MSVEQRSKTENPVEEIRRPSNISNGGFWPIRDCRVRQPFMAKEPLCGNQPTNFSLVIAVLHFPSYFVVLWFCFCLSKEVTFKENIN